MVHRLKTTQPFFNAIDMGVKTFEVRKNDRDFKVGDILVLQEYEADSDTYSGREIKAVITYILDDKKYCLENYVILVFKKL